RTPSSARPWQSAASSPASRARKPSRSASASCCTCAASTTSSPRSPRSTSRRRSFRGRPSFSRTKLSGMRRDPLDYLSRELDSLKAQGLYRRLRVLEDEQKPKATFDHRTVVNLSSNNYLGLTTHPKLRQAALDATRNLGVGSGSVRPSAGTMDIHLELDRRLAAVKMTEEVLVFRSG